ncbi:MAG: ATP-binding protein [Actinomycetota bacterium]|nr:ATP-binding protein [Actinomycetota bacterium]
MTAPEPATLTPDELRTLFLLESLDEERLQWLTDHGRLEERRCGTTVYREGETATCFFVLLEGTIALSRRVGDADVELTRTNQRGAYSGAIQAYIRTDEPGPYQGSMLAITDARFFVIDAADWGGTVRSWFPMAMHLMEGMFIGMRNSQQIVAQRERLLSLGRLSAGLTHELNNPATAVVRATSALRERVTRMRHKLGALASGKLDGATLHQLTAVQDEAIERLPKAPKLTPMQTSDAEDQITDWLDAHHIEGGWELAPTLVAAGVDADWLESGMKSAVPIDFLEGGIRWVTYALETELLMNEIEDASHRISALVGAAKQYTQVDRAAHQEIDVHEGLDSTLTMLGAKLKASPDLHVVKEYDRTLPDIPAYPGELNQVWTNLIDNAIQAMAGVGTLTLRTSRDRDFVLAEIGDTGPGVPAGLVEKIFEPFFTTKPVGEGTGLGLDISYRIVVQRHGGDLKVVSEPGDTRFQVRLPLQAPAAVVLPN